MEDSHKEHWVCSHKVGNSALTLYCDHWVGCCYCSRKVCEWGVKVLILLRPQHPWDLGSRTGGGGSSSCLTPRYMSCPRSHRFPESQALSCRPFVPAWLSLAVTNTSITLKWGYFGVGLYSTALCSLNEWGPGSILSMRNRKKEENVDSNFTVKESLRRVTWPLFLCLGTAEFPWHEWHHPSQKADGVSRKSQWCPRILLARAPSVLPPNVPHLPIAGSAEVKALGGNSR